ncbi:DUF3592 domain-containing protein [Jatrophihabitans sp.]|uniref:DUF3592 domain-containing protein n=1 Tax=Jatrophihabitans sp. TaxID=1932789 RepID=UPI0030C6D1A1|nr:hypothetical protein [Jatrophihabitans sp.]
MARLILIVLAVLDLAAAAVLFAPLLRTRGWTKVPGVIIGIDDRESMRTYAPVVEYTDGTGQTRRMSTSLSGGARPPVGSQVTVSYRSEDPARATLTGVPGQAGAKWLFLVVGVACTVGAILV